MVAHEGTAFFDLFLWQAAAWQCGFQLSDRLRNDHAMGKCPLRYPQQSNMAIEFPLFLNELLSNLVINHGPVWFPEGAQQLSSMALLVRPRYKGSRSIFLQVTHLYLEQLRLEFQYCRYCLKKTWNLNVSAGGICSCRWKLDARWSGKRKQ